MKLPEDIKYFSRVKFTKVFEDGEGNPRTVTEYGRVVTWGNQSCIRPEYASHGYPVTITNSFFSRPETFYHANRVIITEVENIDEPKWSTFREFLEDPKVRECWLKIGVASMTPAHDSFFANPDLELYFKRFVQDSEVPFDPQDVVKHIRMLLDAEDEDTGYTSIYDYEIAGWLWMLWKFKFLTTALEIANLILNEPTKAPMYQAPALAQVFLRK